MSFKNAGRKIQKGIMKIGAYFAPNEALQAVLDARRFNTVINEADNGSNGKYRKLTISYYPLQKDPATDAPTSVCAAGEVIEPKQADFEIKQYTQSKTYQLNTEDVRDVDGNWSFSDHAIAQIASILPAMRVALATDVITMLYANKGCLLDGNASRQVTLSSSATGQVNAVGMWDIEREMKNGGYTPTPFIIGGRDVFNWKKATGVGGTTAQGINIAQMGRTNLYDDVTLNNIVGDAGEHILAFDPTVFKFVTFSENAGIFATDAKGPEDFDKMFKDSKDGTIKAAFLDSVTGIVWDFNGHYDPCANNDKGAFKFKLVLRWDIFFMPNNSLNIDCVNGIFHFTGCPAVIADCPTGTAFPSPLASQTFKFDTDGEVTYPLYVHTATIAGVSTEPNVNITNIAELAAMMSANSSMQFTVSGTELRYTGYSGISFSLNGGNITGTFAP